MVVSEGELTVDGRVSSQFLTALLMTAPLAEQDTTIRIMGDLVSKPYIDITLHLMKAFGIDVGHENYQIFHIKGGQTYRSPGTYLVEGDASSASYFLAAAAIKGEQCVSLVLARKVYRATLNLPMCWKKWARK